MELARLDLSVTTRRVDAILRAVPRYLGNVDFGRHLHLVDLQHHYDQAVFAVGGPSDRRLDIAGEELANSLSSTAFVAWYSRHPDFLDLPVDLGVESAAVVGLGNVAIDVARVVARDPEELATTDISDDALSALRASRVRDVHLLARRGPVQAKSSPGDLKELAQLPGVDLLVDPRELERDPASAAELAGDPQAQKNLEILRAAAERGATGAARRIHLRFLVSPVEGGQYEGPELPVRGVSIDSRCTVPGDLFVALRGSRVDGHDYLGEAFASGAAVALVDRAEAARAHRAMGRAVVLVPDARKGLGDLASAYRKSLDLKVIGITGSCGKTTTKEMLSLLLGARAVASPHSFR